MTNILLIEDDIAIQDVLQMIFTAPEYNLEVCSNGKGMDGKELPDIYLIDKQLEGSDGLDICRMIKTSDHSKHIPVIMISAVPGIEDLALAAGADDAIEKPFPIRTLCDKVQKALAVSPAVQH